MSEKSEAQANQAFRNLRAVLNYARAKYRPENKPLLLENPVSVLSESKIWNKVRARTGRIPNNKVGIAWNVLQEIRESEFETELSYTLADAISFMLLTGARWGEMAPLTWENVNLDEGWWYISDPKNRQPVTFPLSRVCLNILKGRPRINDFVFPGRSRTGHISDARGYFKKISEAIGVQVTPHDMRRTFRAIAQECNIELWAAKLLMGHKLNQDVTISHYTETQDLRYLEKEINKIGDWIVTQGRIAQSDKVVPFPARREGQS